MDWQAAITNQPVECMDVPHSQLQGSQRKSKQGSDSKSSGSLTPDPGNFRKLSPSVLPADSFLGQK